MVISHKHRSFVSLELPHTASTSIRRELCEYYDGTTILLKHASYKTFLKTATDEEKNYFVFSCIRNPLDNAVSVFFKLKTDHRGRFANPKQNKKRRIRAKRIYKFIQENNADFATYFLKIL